MKLGNLTVLTKQELEEEYGPEGIATIKAILLKPDFEPLLSRAEKFYLLFCVMFKENKPDGFNNAEIAKGIELFTSIAYDEPLILNEEQIDEVTHSLKEKGYPIFNMKEPEERRERRKFRARNSNNRPLRMPNYTGKPHEL